VRIAQRKRKRSPGSRNTEISSAPEGAVKPAPILFAPTLGVEGYTESSRPACSPASTAASLIACEDQRHPLPPLSVHWSLHHHADPKELPARQHQPSTCWNRSTKRRARKSATRKSGIAIQCERALAAFMPGGARFGINCGTARIEFA